MVQCMYNPFCRKKWAIKNKYVKHLIEKNQIANYFIKNDPIYMQIYANHFEEQSSIYANICKPFCREPSNLYANIYKPFWKEKLNIYIYNYF